MTFLLACESLERLIYNYAKNCDLYFKISMESTGNSHYFLEMGQE